LRRLSVAVVGCGHNSDNHIRVYANSNLAKLSAVCDRTQGKAELKARKYGAERAYTNYESLLHSDLDLVDIVTPTSTHAPLAVRALESNHNVLVEKPMALTSKECESMISAARRSGRTLCISHTKRFFDCVMQTKKTLELERLEPSRMRFTHFFTLPYPRFGEQWILREDSGGVLWDALVHHAYLIEYFLGKTKSVFSSATRIKQSVWDSITLILLSSGKAGIAEFQWDVKEPHQVYELLTVEGDRFKGDLAHDSLLRRSRSYMGMERTAFRSLQDDIHDPTVKWARHFHNIIEMRPFERALPYERTFFTLISQYLLFLRGLTSVPPVSADEGLQTIRILEAAEKSIGSGKIEALS
jgi:predicted dehydrogenase